jgi:ABC-type methionine transport system permease subunit
MCVLITIFSGFVASIFPWKVGILLDIVTQQNQDNNEHETCKINLILNMIQLTFITLLITVLSFLRSMTLKIYQ